jgi:hypothetical protein
MDPRWPDLIKFVSDLRQVGGFLRALQLNSSSNKNDCNNITKILLKVALNTINLSLPKNDQPKVLKWLYDMEESTSATI